MLLYSQLVFFMLMNNLPDNEVVVSEPVNDNWRNKYLYISPYYSYSLMFLPLLGDGLVGGAGIYNDSVDPWLIAPLDNKVIPMMGAGLGFEFQILNWLSFEPGAQILLEGLGLKGDLEKIIFHVLITAKLKFPLKFLRNVVFEPYLTGGFFPLRFPEDKDIIFIENPTYLFDGLSGLGGGIQIAVKSGNNGALFFDVNYMHYGKTGMKNQYAELYPKPEIIYYSRFDLSFNVGYKFGLFDRKK